jgi:hypothetical protein
MVRGNGKGHWRLWIVVFMLFLPFIWAGVAERAEAASFPAIERLEKHAAQLEQTMKASRLSKPYSLYNQAKKDYEAAKKEVARINNKTDRQRYSKRIANSYHTIQRASYYISAVESGERLTALASRLDQALRSGNLDALYDGYPSFNQQLKKTTMLISKVSDAAIRQKMAAAFERPAEAIKQRAFYPINIMVAMDKIIDAYDNDDINQAERLLALCEQWLPKVQDANTRKQLSVYLQELKAPAVLDIE